MVTVKKKSLSQKCMDKHNQTLLKKMCQPSSIVEDPPLSNFIQRTEVKSKKHSKSADYLKVIKIYENEVLGPLKANECAARYLKEHNYCSNCYRNLKVCECNYESSEEGDVDEDESEI